MPNLNGDIFIATPEEIEKFSERGPTLHSDKPVGWLVSEVVGQSVVNPRAVNRMAFSSPPVTPLPPWRIPGIPDVALLSELEDDGVIRVFLENDDETDVGSLSLKADVTFTTSSSGIPYVGVGPCAHALMEEIAARGLPSRTRDSALYEDFIESSVRSIVVGRVMVP